MRIKPPSIDQQIRDHAIRYCRHIADEGLPDDESTFENDLLAAFLSGVTETAAYLSANEGGPVTAQMMQAAAGRVAMSFGMQKTLHNENA